MARLCHPQAPLLSTELKSYPQKLEEIAILAFSWWVWYSYESRWQLAGRAREVDLGVTGLNDLGGIKERSL